MLVLDSIMISALRGTLEAIRRAAQGELGNGALLREALLDAQLRLESGEIDEQELARLEEEILGRLQATRARPDASNDDDDGANGADAWACTDATDTVEWAHRADAPFDIAPRAGESLTYVYAVIRSPVEPAPRAWPRGVPGSGPVRLVDAGKRLWLVAGSVPRGDYDEAAVADGLRKLEWVGPRALAHESVVGQFLCAPAVLPMRLFTLFGSDERALEHVRRHRRRIERCLDRIAGREEWGLRLTWDGKAGGADQCLDGARQSGTSYLARKRDLLGQGRERQRMARARARELYGELAREAFQAKRRGGKDGLAQPDLLLDAAFLVSTRRTAAFRAALEEHAGELHDAGIAFTLTGPWAPYNFV
jgi:gas vesicle protein GvpL/GvpF/gas vesicle protein GvpG